MCGERNPVRTQFCNFCGAYLGWDDEDEPLGPVLVDEPVQQRIRSELVLEDPADEAPPQDPRPDEVPSDSGNAERLPVPPHIRARPERRQGSRRDPQDDPQPPDPTTLIRTTDGSAAEWVAGPDAALQVEIAEDEVVVTPGAAPGSVTVRVANASTIVDAYDITVMNSPPWLDVTPGRVQLLPGTEEQVQVHLSIRADDLVPVQRASLRLRIQGESAPELRRDARVVLVVGAVTAPPQLRLEPSTLRARDSTTALFRVIVDNRRSNEPLLVHLTGSDPELAARFQFTPPDLEVPPGKARAARMRIDAPLPEPGDQLTRTLTVVASDGLHEHQVRGTFIQASTPPVDDPPVSLRLDPSVVKVQNSSFGHTTLIVDNRRSSTPQQVTISADDDEGAVRFSISPERLDVPAGRTATARIKMHAERPEAGDTCTRPLTVSAWNGEEAVETEGSFVQVSSEWRPIARAVLTLLGSAAMLLGTLLPWTSQPPLSGRRWNYSNVSSVFGIPTEQIDRWLIDANLLTATNLVFSAGAVTILFAVVALFGLTGRTGRLTRAAAVLGAMSVVAFLVVLNIVGGALDMAPMRPSYGFVLVLIGCVIAFVGGHLARR